MRDHKPVYQFTKIVDGKKSDVFACECGVTGYRSANAATVEEDMPIRDPKRFKSALYATCDGKRRLDRRKRLSHSELLPVD